MKIKILFFLIAPVALLIVAPLQGCSEDYSHLPEIKVDFTWLEKQKCFDERSPEIVLENVPSGTKLLQVKMADLDNKYPHGGGTIEYNGDNRIPVGTLKNYQGPCPNWGSPRYEIAVEAMDGNEKILGFGKKIRKFPPEPE